MPFESAVTVATEAPLRLTVGPAEVLAGLSVPEMLHVCGAGVVEAKLALVLPQPTHKVTIRNPTTKARIASERLLTAHIFLVTSAWPRGQRTRVGVA